MSSRAIVEKTYLYLVKNTIRRMKNYFRTGVVVALTTFALYACTDDYFEFDKIRTDE